ncbi:MAG: NAD-dependent epimerase/dehydratase family protein [Halioglobus sp.]
MKCLVSGATGFIGREVCRQLDDRGVSFVALSRSGGFLAGVDNPTLPVDLAVEQVGEKQLSGVDVVFHLAGIAHQKAPASAYEQVNFRATLGLAAAAAVAGVKVFIYLSSVKAMGDPRGSERRTEDNCTEPCDPYGLSKRQSELELQAQYADSPMSVVILRPALVYGAGVAGNFHLLSRAVRAGMPRPPELGGRSMVAREDLVNVMLALAAKPPGPGVKIWIVCDGNSYSAGCIYDLMRSAIGKPPTRSWLPAWVWRWGCAIRDFISRPGLESTYSKVFGTELYSSAALESALSWRPRLALGDCMPEIMSDGLQWDDSAK